jgi:hypothetical protein
VIVIVSPASSDRVTGQTTKKPCWPAEAAPGSAIACGVCNVYVLAVPELSELSATLIVVAAPAEPVLSQAP